MNVAASDAMVLALMLMASVLVPCLVISVVYADRLVDRVAADRQRRRRYRRLDRRMSRRDRRAPLSVAHGARRPTIEWIAADLRRLDRQRNGVARESVAWHAAVLRAYDNRLQLASRCLGVSEHLNQLDGIDREIERMRVEGQLQAAGLALRSPLRRRTDRR